MNDKHQGPHCAGSCEGAAYQIEIRKLRAENEALREALDQLRVGALDNHTVPTDIVADAEYALAKAYGETNHD